MGVRGLIENHGSEVAEVVFLFWEVFHKMSIKAAVCLPAQTVDKHSHREGAYDAANRKDSHRYGPESSEGGRRHGFPVSAEVCFIVETLNDLGVVVRVKKRHIRLSAMNMHQIYMSYEPKT